MRHAHQLTPPVAFFHLAVDQARRHLPLTHSAPWATHLEPLTEVSREGIEVEVEPVTGKERKTARGQALSQSVDDRMCHVLRAGTQLEDGKKLGAGIDGKPEPERLFGAAEAGAQFVQLEVREVEMEEEPLVQSVCVLTSPEQKGS